MVNSEELIATTVSTLISNWCTKH